MGKYSFHLPIESLALNKKMASCYHYLGFPIRHNNRVTVAIIGILNHLLAVFGFDAFSISELYHDFLISQELSVIVLA